MRFKADIGGDEHRGVFKQVTPQSRAADGAGKRDILKIGTDHRNPTGCPVVEPLHTPCRQN